MITNNTTSSKKMKHNEKKTDKDSKMGFINESGLEFSDISTELYRIYHFPNGQTLRIEQPTHLNVSRSGGHRLFTADGYSWYVQPKEGWAIMWKSEIKHFVK